MIDIPGSVKRKIAPLLIGLFATAAILYGLQQINFLISPLPSGATGKEKVEAWFASLPGWALVCLLVEFMVGTTAGGWVAARLAGEEHFSYGLVHGGLVFAIGASTPPTNHLPDWFGVASLIGLLAAGLAGGTLARRQWRRGRPETRRQDRNWDQIVVNWKRLTGKVKERWGKLTDDDLTASNGERGQLADRLQERYGYDRERAEKELDDFAKTLRK
jgi:uncharacterized protein YjbJ (UPF0337 family)